MEPTKRQQEIADAYQKNNRNKAATARALGIGRKAVARTLRVYWDKIGMDHAPTDDDKDNSTSQQPATSITTENNSDDNSTVITTKSPQIKTLEQALAYAEVDIDKYRVKKYTVNSWEVTMGANKTHSGRPETYTNYQVKVWLEERTIAPMVTATENLISRMPKLPAVKTPKQTPNGVLMELCIFDHHFGCLAWHRETGEDYDLGIAKKVMLYAIRQHLTSAQARGVNRILIPLGNDVFHLNDPTAATPTNGNPLDTDCRLAKVFEVAEETWILGIKECAEVAPVDVLWVPGNHDPQTGYYLARVLKRAFEDTKTVNISDDITPRKYYRFGKTLLGYTHGDQTQDQQLPLLMAEERPDYGECRWKEWHVAHLHKKKETHFNVGNTHGGVKVVHLPSMAGTDYWHFNKGFIKQLKTTEANFYAKQGEPAGYEPAVIPQSMYRQSKALANV